MACDKTGETWKVLRISFHLNVMSFTTGGTQYEVHHVPALIFLYLKELSIVLHMPSAVKSHSTLISITTSIPSSYREEGVKDGTRFNGFYIG